RGICHFFTLLRILPTQNLTIGSRLYGESSKIQPGVLSGSATLLMILP
ncbi:TPA: PapG chaperone-binding domain-containing protein, partial [Escherichia coli]